MQYHIVYIYIYVYITWESPFVHLSLANKTVHPLNFSLPASQSWRSPRYPHHSGRQGIKFMFTEHGIFRPVGGNVKDLEGEALSLRNGLKGSKQEISVQHVSTSFNFPLTCLVRILLDPEALAMAKYCNFCMQSHGPSNSEQFLSYPCLHAWRNRSQVTPKKLKVHAPFALCIK